MEIRNAHKEEIEEIMEIYAQAREFMKKTGNPNQWGLTSWPPRALIEKDIQQKKSYVLIDQDAIQAVFFYDYGKDIEDTYKEITDGAWLSDAPYGVVHRIASAHRSKAAGETCIRWALQQCHNVRIDTHADNKIMQHVLQKIGFHYCGIIYVHEDRDPRYAYQLEVQDV